jgi:lipid II:glycine glycyltransferase (peptidoglycan interpeptide bridge formation enzyme)
MPDAAAALQRLGARRTRSIQPEWTWILDLDVDEDALRRGLERGHRSRINAASRRGISVRTSADPSDIEVFIALQHRAGDHSGWRGRSAGYHRAEARVLMPSGAAALYIADVDGQPVAAAMGFDFGATRHYAHATSDPVEGRRLGAGPPLIWQMILDARSRGQTQFDFWGVTPDDDPKHPWAGFSAFKKGFGGRLVRRSGTWELPVRPARYRLYAAMNRFR